ncbi:DMT family transporter [Achromobacter mucicolens]|uniref:DMT family transporter n=1 Tax=Achromobacter mucicolens TaxID=1389922 RepID=UPI002FE3EA52
MSYLFPLFAILFWAGNVIVSKMAASAISPTAITFYRLLLALFLMGLFTARPAWRNRRVILRHWPKLALYGALSSAVFQALSYRAAETTTATNMAILTALIPLLSMLGSVVILRDPLTVGMAAGGALSFLGLLYLVGQGDMLSVFQHGVHVGDGLMLLAALSYALYGVLLRHWKVPVPAWQSTFVQSIFALIYMLPLYLRVPAAQAALDVNTIPLILYAGIFSSVLLSYLWIEGVHRQGPNRCSIFISLLPLFTALAAFVMLREHLQRYHVLGGAVTLAGVLLAQTVQRPLFGAGRALAAGKA